MSRTLDPNTQYADDGKPVAGGKAYYGVANQDPKLNPITIWGERTLTSMPLTNPQDTNQQGRVENRVFVGVNEYSYLVEDELGNQLVWEPLLEPINTIGLVTQDVDMNGFKFTDVADAVADDQCATLGQSNRSYAQTISSDASSTPDAIVANLALPPIALVDNQRIIVQIDHGPNTIVAPTFKLNLFAEKRIFRGAGEDLQIADTEGAGNFLHLAYSAALDAWCLVNTDSQGIIFADIDMDGFKHTNVADPVANNEYATLGMSNKMYPFVVPTNGISTPDAVSVDLPIQPDALVNGQQIIIEVIHGPNTITTPTLKFGTEPALVIYRDNAIDLFVGDTGGSGRYKHLIYNAALTAWSLVNPSNLAVASISGSVSPSGQPNMIELNSIGASNIAADAVGASEIANNVIDESRMLGPIAGTSQTLKRLVDAGSFVGTGDNSYDSINLFKQGGSSTSCGFIFLVAGTVTLQFDTNYIQGGGPVDGDTRLVVNEIGRAHV